MLDQPAPARNSRIPVIFEPGEARSTIQVPGEVLLESKMRLYMHHAKPCFFPVASKAPFALLSSLASVICAALRHGNGGQDEQRLGLVWSAQQSDSRSANTISLRTIATTRGCGSRASTVEVARTIQDDGLPGSKAVAAIVASTSQDIAAGVVAIGKPTVCHVPSMLHDIVLTLVNPAAGMHCIPSNVEHLLPPALQVSRSQAMGCYQDSIQLLQSARHFTIQIQGAA
jgi:hypothetical protein